MFLYYLFSISLIDQTLPLHTAFDFPHISKVGGYLIKADDAHNFVTVYWHSHQVSQIPGDTIMCNPVVSGENVVVPAPGKLVCLNRAGHKVWDRDLEYDSNPTRLLLFGKIVVADTGPPSVGSRLKYKSISEYYFAVQNAWHTIGLDASSGQVIWRLQNGYAGVPVVALDQQRLLCVSMTSSKRHVFDGKRLFLNEINAVGMRNVCWQALAQRGQSLKRIYLKLISSFSTATVASHSHSMLVHYQRDSTSKADEITITIGDKSIIVRCGGEAVSFEALR